MNTDDVATAIFSAVRPWLTADTDRIEAKDMAKTASGSALVTRESVLGVVVKLALDHDWSESVLELARKRLVKLVNDKAQVASLRTFASEIGAAAHPRVRESFTVIQDAVNEAWGAESEPDATARPIKTAFQRRYLTLIRCLVQAKEGRLLSSAHLVVAFARENDPTGNAEKAAKRVQGLLGDLRDIALVFPANVLRQAADLLEGISSEVLLTARVAQKTTKPATRNTVVAETPEPQGGVVDIDDLLDDNTTLAEAA